MSAVIEMNGTGNTPNFNPGRILPGFEHVKRYWDPSLAHMTVKLLPGEFYVTSQEEALTTVLGSCISACIRDVVKRVGGMNHFMLPEPSGGESSGWAKTSRAARYGSDAMEHLINAILKAGGTRQNFEIKIFGGGRVLAQMTDVGRRNIEFAHNYLMTEGLRLSAEDVGDIYPRQVQYFPWSGKARVKHLRSVVDNTIIEREKGYLKQLEKDPIKGDIELF